MKTPPIAFGNAVLVLAATETSNTSPYEFRISSIRQCRRTGVIVVSTIETYIRNVTTGMLSRDFDLVRVQGRELAKRIVLFDQHIRLVP